MIVQPAPLGPRGRPRRVLGLVGLVVPVLLFAGVVAAGVLGPTTRPAPSRVPASDEGVANATPTPAASLPPVAPEQPIFPSRIAGLEVHGVHWTLEARNRGLARGVIAVAGFLGLDTIPGECRDSRLGVFGPFCRRVAVLGEMPWYGATHSSPDPAGFHLHPQFPVGVRIPSQASFVAMSPSTATPPVILLARFSDPRAEACVPGGRHCGQELVVERVAWVDGDEYPTTPTIDPAVDAGGTLAELRRDGAQAGTSLPAGGYPLFTALVAPATIAAVEPAAADAATGLSGPVWLLRGLHAQGDPSRVDWRIVARDGLGVLAEGSVETAPFPDMAAGAGADATGGGSDAAGSEGGSEGG
jgi:hypothetical protein